MEDLVLLLMASLLVGGLLAGPITKAINSVKNTKLMKEFDSRYGIKLDNSFTIRKCNAGVSDLCKYELGFAKWEHARVNGTRDRRYNINRLMREPSVLMFDGWKIRNNSPYLMADHIRELRNSGINISGADISYAYIAAHSPKDAGIY